MTHRDWLIVCMIGVCWILGGFALGSIIGRVIKAGDEVRDPFDGPVPNLRNGGWL
jgi:hypothetical protein